MYNISSDSLFLAVMSRLALLPLLTLATLALLTWGPTPTSAGHGHKSAGGTACIVKGSYCKCHYCKCEHGHVHCGYGKHGHGEEDRERDMISIFGDQQIWVASDDPRLEAPFRKREARIPG